jgi:diguanylate cyclase (GGDEF)-like protein/PAS domain S-box-containing protein
MSDPNARLFKLLRMYCEGTAIAVAVMGCLVLFGWAFHIEWLKIIVSGDRPLKPNTALSFVISGTSLWLLLPGESRTRKRHIAHFLALLVTFIGAATMSEYLFGLNLWIDELLFNDPAGATATSLPGRMSVTSTATFLAIGLALLLLDRKTRRGHRPAQVLSLCAMLISMMAIGGYLYHATGIYGLTPITIRVNMVLFLLGGAVFFARPRTSIAGDLTGEGSGSVMARRLFLAIFCVPIILGWIVGHGQIARLYGTELELALYAISNVIVFGVLVWLNARKMNVEYSQRSRAEAEVRELNTELEGRVARRTKTLEQQAVVLTEQAALLDLAHDAIIVRGMDGRIAFWNRGAERMYGWPAKLTVGNVGFVLLKTEFPQPIEEIEAKLLQLGHWEGEMIQYTRNGLRLKISTRWALQRDADDAPVRTLIINTDITDRKQAESKLRLLTERLSLATAIAKVGVWEWDLASNTLTWDATMLEIYGFPAIVPMPHEKWSGVVFPEDLPAVEASLRKVIEEKGQGAAEFRITRADGAVRNISTVERVVLDEHANVIRVIGVNMDITERRVAEETLRNSETHLTYSSQHDFLTGLPNRVLLNDRISQAIVLVPRHKKQIAVLFLDLDGFKHINDSLGHAIGDKLLQSIAKRLLDCVRFSDTVSRQGGDEFVVLLAEVDHSEDAAITARRMLQVVAEAHSIDEHDLHVTASIGVSVYPDDGLDAETLIKNADTAMYQAKENGRQSYQFFKPSMNIRAVERQSMEESLRRALERKEFQLLYQPKVSLRTGKITGAEALIRWTHPIRGAIAPAQFIPVAEDCGLILPIGNWALREACKQARAWVDAGLPLATMAVNVTAMEFRQENFLEGVFTILKDTGLDPRSLELELTESALMKRAESTESILKTLRDRGVQLAIDDFGTGYSSLSYLRMFPVDALKIDQSFVRQITSAPQDTTIVTAIISMGRSLKLRVVAEGVETREELEFLRARQCDEAQGYFFSRPVLPQKFALLLEMGVPEAVVLVRR